MTKQTLTQNELDAMAAAMEAADFGEEIEIEIVDEDDYEDDYENDGQPSEYEEWQDVYGGDDWDHGQYDDDYYDGGIDY
tara:strand:- start:59 stop:295 length:237 start_codon:yes stop_codon:yes gene_type:complete